MVRLDTRARILLRDLQRISTASLPMIKPVPCIRFVWTYQGRFRPGRSVGNGRSRSAGNRGRRERFGSMPLSWSLLSWAHHPTPWACARPNYGDIVTASLNMFLTLRVALAIHRFAPAHVKHLEELLPSRCARLAWNPTRCARSLCQNGPTLQQFTERQLP